MELKPGYKQTEVGVIPEEWVVKRLGDVANVDPENLASNTSPYYTFNYISLEDVDLGTLQGYSNKVFSTAPSRARRKLQKGDILISTVRPNLKSHLLFSIDAPTPHWVCSTGFSVVRCWMDIVHPGFVFFHLFEHAILRQIEMLLTGSNYPAINGGDVRALQIPLPRYDEQAAIAAALSDVDTLMGALDRLIAKKRDLKQAAMQRLLTGRTRLRGFDDKWDVIRFSGVADKTIPWSLVGGPFGSNLKVSDYVTEGVRIIQLQNIGDGKFHNDYAIYTSNAKADELLSNNIYPGEIILSKMGNPVARACFVPEVDSRYLMASDGIRLVVDQRRFNKRFVHDYINSPYFRKRAMEASTGSTRQRIAISNLKALPFVAPPRLEQTAIATILSDMDAEIAALEARREKTRLLKQGMMQELLTGRIRLI